jgi:deazaflavin-dependent oxidoreductase (nitroreductase family)
MNEAEPLPERKRNPFIESVGGGRTISALMLPLFAPIPPQGFGVLTTTGRRTGKTRRKCVHVVRRGNRAYIVMLRLTPRTIEANWIAGWLWNIRADPRVRLRMHGGTFAGVARELQDAAEIEQAADIYCGSVYFPFDYIECGFHRGGLPTRAKIRELHRSWFKNGIPLVVELGPAGYAATGSS